MLMIWHIFLEEWLNKGKHFLRLSHLWLFSRQLRQLLTSRLTRNKKVKGLSGAESKIEEAKMQSDANVHVISIIVSIWWKSKK